MAFYQVGDEFQGDHDELFSFIHKVRNAGGTVKMISHDIARITSLPAPPLLPRKLPKAQPLVVPVED
jgi:hypothetical protein